MLYPNQALPPPVYTNLSQLAHAAQRKFSMSQLNSPVTPDRTSLDGHHDNPSAGQLQQYSLAADAPALMFRRPDTLVGSASAQSYSPVKHAVTAGPSSPSSAVYTDHVTSDRSHQSPCISSHYNNNNNLDLAKLDSSQQAVYNHHYHHPHPSTAHPGNRNMANSVSFAARRGSSGLDPFSVQLDELDKVITGEGPIHFIHSV